MMIFPAFAALLFQAALATTGASCEGSGEQCAAGASLIQQHVASKQNATDDAGSLCPRAICGASPARGCTLSSTVGGLFCSVGAAKCRWTECWACSGCRTQGATKCSIDAHCAGDNTVCGYKKCSTCAARTCDGTKCKCS
eukprot:TRINITY_DN4455_c1_g1_i1.p2 TRINITY_DN4455_c1_g1~~TRINITY_DN4455_c1_g1_i1.p2  ORF type:complete len:140 (+),score=19.44 TRINITY_DN4455_c1_g1_i1:78-497(+)